MSASIVEVARKSGEAADNASNSGNVAETGGQVVQEAARLSLDASLEQYRSGLINHIPVIAAQQASLSADLSAIQADRDALDARIQLHTALGSAAVPSGDAR